VKFPEDGKSIVVYSTTWCPDCKRAKKFFGEQRIPYINIDIEEDGPALELVQEINGGKRVVPTIIFPDGDILVEPSNAQLAAKLGLQTKAQRQFYDVIVVGGGPAGLTAALYLAREGLETLVIERSGLGGQVGVTQTLDNFPGFDEGIPGGEFADRLGRQARRFGAEILTQDVVRLEPQGRYLCATTADGTEHGANALLLASGAQYRRLNVPGEEELLGTRIHFCATCDGAFYKGGRLLVIGGGNSGFEEGLYLTRYAREVDIVEFEPQVKASQVLQDEVAQKANMRVITHHAVMGFAGSRRLEAVYVRDRATGEDKLWHYDGVFVFIGLTPNSRLVAGQVETDGDPNRRTSCGLRQSF